MLSEMLDTSRFTEHLVRANRLDNDTLKEWVFCPGMLFRANAQWWGDHRDRTTPHEGLDLCFYRDREGRIQSLDNSTWIPAMFEGTVVGIIPDFLGRSVVLRHQIPGDGARVFCTMYGHTNPESEMQIGQIVREGETIARLTHTRSSSTEVRAHLHLSIGLVPATFLFEGLDWAAIGDPGTMTLVDPLPTIGPASVVPNAALFRSA
jgi:murein DD-endopeptidase MepM/ murein hydrolase activator NlpD